MALIDQKEYNFLLDLLDGHDKKEIRDFVQHSEIEMHSKQVYLPGGYKARHWLRILVHPSIFKKYYAYIQHFKSEIARKVGEIRGVNIGSVEVQPELSKYQILQNPILPVVTPWEEINSLQTILLTDLKNASSTIHFQNIGNSARTLMLKLANAVFIPERHLAPPGINISEGFFKNRLHTYIKTELKTDQQKELRKYIDSIIESTEKGIDLMNKVTHDTRTNNIFAEASVISVVTTIELVRLVHSMSKS